MLKLKAGALQLSIFITTIIALLLFGFILYVHSIKVFQTQNEILKNIIKENQKVFNNFMTKTISEDSLYVYSEVDEFIENKVKKSKWGYFDMLLVFTKRKSKKVEKCAILGGVNKKFHNSALYLENKKNTLILVGDSYIEGDAYLPERGVKAGEIRGKYYNRRKYIHNGNLLESGELPKLDLDNLKALQKGFFNTDKYDFENLNFKKEHINSFFNKTKIFYSNEPIYLLDQKIIGNFIVYSEHKITISSYSVLKDIILIAPEIEIESNFKNGNFQAIASKKLIVNKNIKLNYPTLLALIEEQKQEINEYSQEQEEIPFEIKENSKIFGQIIYSCENKRKPFDIKLKIPKNVTIKGEVYSNGNLDLEGSIFGTLYLSNFIAKKGSSSYMNHLYNGTIINRKREEEYVGFTFDNSEQKIIKWLY